VAALFNLVDPLPLTVTIADRVELALLVDGRRVMSADIGQSDQ